MAAVATRYRALTPSGRRTLHVDPRADAGRASHGSPSSPFRTPQGALEVARPGDRILLHAGLFPPLDLYGLQGDPDAWISIEAADGDGTALIDARSSPRDGIDVQRSRCVGLFGLRIAGRRRSENSDASGVAVFRGSAHVRVWRCSVRDFPGGGINCFWTPAVRWEGAALPAGGWDAVDLAFNRVEGCCRFSTWNTSGISFFGAEDLAVPLPGGWGYRAVGNTVHDCVCTVPYERGGLDVVTDGNGISVDSLLVRNALTPGLPPYTRPGLIEGNLVTANGGRGLHVYESAGVLDLCNTYAGNLRSDGPALEEAAEVQWTRARDGRTAPVRHVGDVVAPRAGRRAFAGAGVRRAEVVVRGGSAGSARGRVSGESAPAYFAGDEDGAFRPLRGDRVERLHGALDADVGGLLTPGSGRWAGAVRPLHPLDVQAFTT